MMSEQQFLWNSLDGGENVFIKERGSDKIIHIKIIEGKHEFVDFMKKVNGQQAEIERLNQETEVRECQFCGEFRTEYHEYEDYSWSAEDYCNAGHDLEDTNPNNCKDYWDNFD